MLKWSIELSQFDITYTPRTSINGQVLADFIVEFAHRPHEEGEIEENEPAHEEEKHPKEWTLHVDGASNEGGASASIVIRDLKGTRYIVP